jgi:hypothetical protein
MKNSSYILVGLNEDFDPMVSAVIARVEPITPAGLYSHMLSHELRQDRHTTDGHSGSYSSANAAVRGRGDPGRSPSRGCICGRGGQRSAGTNNNNTNSRSSTSRSADGWPLCQVCLRPGHTANICWYRYEEEYVPDPKTVAAASTSHGTDPQWYLNSRATYHLTGELDKLTMHDHYHGHDQVRTANGTGMAINHISTSVIPTSFRDLHLHNVLHAPHTDKHLISIHHFNLDNHTYVELHPYFFLIKDQVTKKVLLRGPCKGGLYPILSSLPPHL